MKILLAIDDSRFSEEAVKAVIAQARPENTEVLVLNVVEMILIPTGASLWVNPPDTVALRNDLMQKGRELVNATEKKLREARFKVTARVEEGDPRTRILDVAAEFKADLIVLGSHGRKGLDRFFLGSVSEAVARHAHCSVEIVRGLGTPGSERKSS